MSRSTSTTLLHHRSPQALICSFWIIAGAAALVFPLQAAEPVVTASLMMLLAASLAAVSGDSPRAGRWAILATIGWIGLFLLFGPASKTIRPLLPTTPIIESFRGLIMPPELPGTVGERTYAAQRFDLIANLGLVMLAAAAATRLRLPRHQRHGEVESDQTFSATLNARSLDHRA